MKRTIALVLSYDGNNYHGWQTQENAQSVQSTLLSAVSSLFGEDVKVTGCGRTDTGVHARKYVATVLTNSQIPCERIPFALNSLLPYDISVKNATDVPENFHPVHSCIEKEYTYYIYTDKIRDPFFEKRVLHYRYPLDVELMKKAALHFVGTHDFSSMRSLGTPVKSTVRTVFKCDIGRTDNIISVTISANGFLYNMARTIVGTLLDVGTHKIPPDEIVEILRSCDRTKAGATAPAHGLYMTNVIYPPEFGL
ncbi:MAG: tRNA pseudouridine(38-40) synthase TruA [Oscillospiraceae bacterium]|nr:tRNA pseudouridine(38-40) synthase TruA [Oscillospiraceae bacterium]